MICNICKKTLEEQDAIINEGIKPNVCKKCFYKYWNIFSNYFSLKY